MKPNALELADNLVLNCTVYTRYAANDELRRLHLVELQYNKVAYKCLKLEKDLSTAQETCGVLVAQRNKLVETLKTMVDLYCDLVNSGDCGYWDPTSDPKVQQAIQLIENTT